MSKRGWTMMGGLLVAGLTACAAQTDDAGSADESDAQPGAVDASQEPTQEAQDPQVVMPPYFGGTPYGYGYGEPACLVTPWGYQCSSAYASGYSYGYGYPGFGLGVGW